MKRKKRKTKIKMKIDRGNLIFLCVIALTASVAIVIGQTEPNALPAEDESVLLEQQDSGLVFADEIQHSETSETVTNQPVQSISFRQDMSVRDALRFLAAKYRKNIIPSAKVNGSLNVTNLYEVTFEEALNAVIGKDYRYEIGDNFIKVYAADEYTEMVNDNSRMTSRVFTLNYVNAAEIKALVTPVLSEAGKVGTTSAAGVDTEAGKGGDSMSMKDSVVVYDFPERLDQIGAMIKEVDIKPQQIMIEVTILKATLTETTQFGINWNTIGGVTVNSTTNGITVGFASAPLDIPAGTGLNVGFTNDNLVSYITALEGITDATVLANPKIMALNKQAGHINIGNETGYTESTTQSGTSTTSSIAFLESGTLLKFRPFICDNGYVRMEINPEESTATTTTSDDGSIVIPSKTITQVKTNIMVKDGKTIIIGGLFKEDLTSADSQVPVVGDVPILGALFKKTKDTNIRSELIILITPHIINDPEELAAASEEKVKDVSRIVGGSRKRISSIARERIYEENYAKAVRYYSEKNYDKALAELNWIIAFRPNVLEAVQLKEKILAETKPDEYETLERIMLDNIRKEQDVMWKRR